MLGKFKEDLTGERKLFILFSILFVFNILLFINLFAYISIFNDISVDALHELGTIIAAIIILSFISTRLPRLKENTDGSIYEIAYLIIMGILSITISYFNKSANGESLWAPFLEMFRMLAVMLILIFVATKSKSFQALIANKTSRRNQIGLIIVFAILGIIASHFTLNVYGVPANARGLVVMIAALTGGPLVGIPVGIIAGVWRFFLGGPTAFACAVVTIITGFVGGLVYKWMDGEFLSPFKAALLMFLFSGFDMFMVTVLTPQGGIGIANALYAPMTFTAVLGILLFTIFLNEKKEEVQINLQKEYIDQINRNKEDISANTENIAINTANISLNKEHIFAINRHILMNANTISELSDEIEELKKELDELKRASNDNEI